MADEVKLEEEWSREKAARQEAARQPPPRKSRVGLVIVIVGALVVAAIVAILISTGDDRPTAQTAEKIKVEIRAIPTATIRIDGKKVGTTPISLSYARSTKQIVIEATMIRHLVKRGATKDETYVERRTITVDRDALVDFKLSTATLVDVDLK